MPIDRDVLEAVREMDEHGLRRLLMLARARLERRGVPTGEATDAKVTLRKQEVRCGKASCTTCPHGPYWYAYWTEEGRRRSRYIGKLDDVPEEFGGVEVTAKNDETVSDGGDTADLIDLPSPGH